MLHIIGAQCSVVKQYNDQKVHSLENIFEKYQASGIVI